MRTSKNVKLLQHGNVSASGVVMRWDYNDREWWGVLLGCNMVMPEGKFVVELEDGSTAQIIVSLAPISARSMPSLRFIGDGPPPPITRA
jgi:hypothetical protein